MSKVLSDKEIIERARKGIVKTPYQAKRLVELLEEAVTLLGETSFYLANVYGVLYAIGDIEELENIVRK